MPSSNPCPPSLSFWQRSDEAAFRGEFSSHTPTQVSLLVWAGSCLRLSFQIATPAPAVCRTLCVPGVRGEEHWLLLLALTLISHHELWVTSQIFSKLRGDSAASSVKGVPFWNSSFRHGCTMGQVCGSLLAEAWARAGQGREIIWECSRSPWEPKIRESEMIPVLQCVHILSDGGWALWEVLFQKHLIEIIIFLKELCNL